MFKSKVMILFVVFVFGVAYLGTEDNTMGKKFDDDVNNIIIVNE